MYYIMSLTYFHKAQAKSPKQKNLDVIEYEKIRQKCVVCGNEGIFICGRCQYVKYCSRDCQLEDWHYHKTLCKNIEKENNI